MTVTRQVIAGKLSQKKERVFYDRWASSKKDETIRGIEQQLHNQLWYTK
jgi:hypothetical protein